MSKKEYSCFECDNNYTVKTQSPDPIKWCPFCGAEINLDDGNEYDDDASVD